MIGAFTAIRFSSAHPMNQIPSLNQLIRRFQSQTPIRAISLIMTVYGDAIEPRGGAIWLGSLINLLEPFGINERLTRTSIFRLTQDDWVTAEKVGRRSYYSLTATGMHRIEKAARRIYFTSAPDWDGSWLMVMLSRVDVAKRRQVRQELEWLGYANITPGVMASPIQDRVELIATLQENDVLDRAIIFQTQVEEGVISPALREQVRDGWHLDELAQEYAEFIQFFRPLWQAMSEQQALDPQACFIARTLLIHEYRKILLRDPQLPETLLPPDWQGRAARQLCRNLYRLVYAEAERWLTAVVETAEGPLPEVNERFYRRFGGLI